MPLYIVMASVFLGMVFILFFLIYVFAPKKTVLEERLESLTGPTAGIVLERPPSRWKIFLANLGKQVPLKPEHYGKYTGRLVAAGIKKEGLAVFMGVKILLALLLPLAYLVFYGIPLEKDFMNRVLISLILAIAGFLLPSYWLSRKVKKRQLQIFHDLPDMLDLMTVCVEAGMSMDAALVKICEEQQFKESPLVAEIKIVLQETRAGKPRHEALRDMGVRTKVDDLRTFAAMLIQTERLGTSLAQSLRIHSDSYRTIRMQKAQEMAAKTAVKLVFPLVFFILPALFVVMLLPAVIRMSRVLSAL